MGKIKKFEGSSIMEVIVAMGIFVLITSSVVILYIGAYGSSLRDTERLQADMFIQQGFEAIRSIRDYNFKSLKNGTFGLSKSSGYWEIYGKPDILGQYTRVVTISDMRRNDNCELVEKGGDLYGSTKKVVVDITWDFEEGNSTSISSTKYFTEWDNPVFCFAGGDADYLVVDTSGAKVSKNKIEGLEIENINKDVSIVVDKITVSWDIRSSLIEGVEIDDEYVWRSKGVGSPEGKQSSGTELDVDNFTLKAGKDYEIDKFRFSKKMGGATISIVFEMQDGSTLIVPKFKPKY